MYESTGRLLEILMILSTMNNHDFKIEDYFENDVLKGTLQTCNKCSYEHLCPKNVMCVHLEAHETGCEKN